MHTLWIYSRSICSPYLCLAVRFHCTDIKSAVDSFCSVSSSKPSSVKHLLICKSSEAAYDNQSLSLWTCPRLHSLSNLTVFLIDKAGDEAWILVILWSLLFSFISTCWCQRLFLVKQLSEIVPGSLVQVLEEIRLFWFRTGLSLFVICSPHQDFNEDYSDLDGIVQQRRQEMEESSSTGSQTPELECFQGECDHGAPREQEWTSSQFCFCIPFWCGI